jgi:hypothetical protein
MIEERVFFTRTGVHPRIKSEGMLRLKTRLKKTRQNKKIERERWSAVVIQFKANAL